VNNQSYLALLALQDSDDLSKAGFHIKAIALDDVAILTTADQQYGSSWRKRGGVGAYIVGIRKADRMEQQLQRCGNDLREAVRQDRRAEGIMNDLRDLRRYFYLWDSYAMSEDWLASGSSVPELVHPLLPWEPVETVCRQNGYDIFATFRDHRGILSAVKYWRKLLLRWELVLQEERLVPGLTPMEQEHRGIDGPGYAAQQGHVVVDGPGLVDSKIQGG
jgi:hypothetical protein